MRMNRHRAWTAITLSLVLGAMVAVPVITQAANNGPKSHDPSATASLNAGTNSTVVVSVTNTTTSGNITAEGIRVYIHSTLPVSRFGTAVPSAGTITPQTTTLTADPPYFEIFDAHILRNRTWTLTIPVKVPCADFGSSYAWETDVRQSNDFNGANNQIPSSASEFPTTTVTTSCSLVFSAQPKNATPGASISTVAFNPSAAPVAVTVKSGGSSPTTVTDSTLFSGSISLGSTPTTSIAGTTSVAPTAGVATFPGISIAAEGTYTLGATATNATGATSSSFKIGYGTTSSCVAGDSQACSTGTVPGPTGGTTGSVTVNDNDGLTADLIAEFRATDIDCSSTGYVEFGDNLFFDVTNITAGGTAGLTKTVTITKPIPDGRPHVTGTDEWRYQLCFQSRDQFEAIPTYSSDPQVDFDNLLQALSNGDFTDPAEVVPVGDRVLGDLSAEEYRGLLPKCSLVSNQVPCLTSVTFGPATADAPNGTATFVASVKVADPMTR